MKKVGGVWRPISDVEEPTRETSSQQPRAIPSAGSTPVVSPSENASTQLVANALRAARQEPEFGDDKAAALKHLSAMHPADPFDREAYLKDPDAYVQDVQPGRIWQSAPEGPDVKPIERIGDFYREMVSGETAQLKVKVEPGYAATFYSPTLGRFDNKLTTITVRADENGIATANFHAAPGTRGDVTVVVASPVNSQQAKFNLRVVMPDHAGVSPSRQ